MIKCDRFCVKNCKQKAYYITKCTVYLKNITSQNISNKHVQSNQSLKRL